MTESAPKQPFSDGLDGCLPSQLDAHCHIQESAFDPDRDTVLARAREKGIVRFWSDSCVESDWSKLERLVEQYGAGTIRPGFGIHPWFANQTADGWESRLEAQLGRFPLAAVAEIGLDRFRTRQVPWNVQIPVFQTQLSLAARLNRPATIHCVRAWDVMAPILKQVRPRNPIVFHAFGGTKELTSQLLNLCDCRFSFSTARLHSGNPNVQNVYRFLLEQRPDRVLYESDAPFMPLIKGTRNESAFCRGGE